MRDSTLETEFGILGSHKMHSITAEEIRKRVESINVWKRGDERAPHKPLLMLLALARLKQGKPRLAPFSEIEKPLTRLLRDFGPPRQSLHAEYPFWWLQNDDLWVVIGGEQLERRKSNTNPKKRELVTKRVEGGLPDDVFEAIAHDSQLFRDVVLSLLDGHFPESMHEDLLSEISLDNTAVYTRQKRDTAFRENVVVAYNHCCAICGFGVRLGNSDLALEAAHIKWKQARGPDVVQNGLALCAIHHKALDRGAIGINADREVLISVELFGDESTMEWFTRFNRKPLLSPNHLSFLPSPDFLAWHDREVFRHPART